MAESVCHGACALQAAAFMGVLAVASAIAWPLWAPITQISKLASGYESFVFLQLQSVALTVWGHWHKSLGVEQGCACNGFGRDVCIGAQ